jgi:hypothetical protein
VELAAGSVLHRVYNPAFPGFRYFGPLLQRFDHHEGVPGTGAPRAGPRGIFYCAPTLACCVVEVFGATGIVEITTHMLATTALGRPLRVLDLRRTAAMLAGTVAALAYIRERALTQAWSRFFYEHTDLYGLLDGLLYPSAHSGADALALYERAEDALFGPAASLQVQPLASPALDVAVRASARAHGMVMR